MYDRDVFNKGRSLVLQDIAGMSNEVSALHVHLGGSLTLESVFQMAQRQGMSSVTGTRSDFVQTSIHTMRNAASLNDYLRLLHDVVEPSQCGKENIKTAIYHACDFLSEREGVLDRGNSFGEEVCVAYKLPYIEIRFNPMKRSGITRKEDGHHFYYDPSIVLKSARDAAGDVGLTSKGRTKIRLIVCFARDLPNDVNLRQAELIAASRRWGHEVVGLDLAGPEDPEKGCDLSSKLDIDNLCKWYDIAGGESGKAGSLGRTIHLGETCYTTMSTFCEVIEVLRPQRLAHPIAAFRAAANGDSRGLQALKEHGVVVEFCPYSNLLTKAVANWREWKSIFECFDKFEIPWFLSTDNPGLQRSTLAGEVSMLRGYGSLTREQHLRALSVSNQCRFDVLLPQKNGN